MLHAFLIDGKLKSKVTVAPETKLGNTFFHLVGVELPLSTSSLLCFKFELERRI